MIRIKKGPALWQKAKKIIPGGTNLRSKYAELFAPGLWPSYFSKAKGIKVWDLDGNCFKDFSIFGIGACVLGYSDDDVNRAVINAVRHGSMTSCNCPEDIELATMLLKMHPWAGMVRFARTGGEAMAVAVRIARAYTGRDIIAFCGYHGWHDWYISANLADASNLDGHILPGLEPKGVPRCLKKTAIPFSYNNIDEISAIASNNKLAAIIMEPMRSTWPENNFLQKVKEIAKNNGAVLIFDEITSGFRMNVGGIHEILGVQPDIAVYAKAINNGFPMAAIVGKHKIMKMAEESFISSSYWTERIGPVAAIATIKKMKKENVPAQLVKIGKKIMDGWNEIAKQNHVKIKIYGIPPLASFTFDYSEALSLQTLFTREILKHGYLAWKSVYVSYAHKEKEVEKYLCAVNNVFSLIANALKKGNVDKLIKGKVANPGFKRLVR
ncbi:MAG: aminotransferase class III-fold pyridoxal phosphate-dependent enzyme [Candidatus Ratteibacteria bacterium]